LGNKNWTGEWEHSLNIKSNGGLCKTIKKVKHFVGKRGEKWDFVGSFRIYAEPPIIILYAEKDKILEILHKNGLLAN